MYLRIRYKYGFLWLLLLLGACGTPEPFHHAYASGYYGSGIESCVPYTRRVTGIKLYGNADSWWQEAEGRYQRGSVPVAGSVLVLKKTTRMHAGHVAVVKNVINARQINVTQSNWGDNRESRHIIYESQLAEDVSPANDWTQIRFWNDKANVLGYPYAAYGFIYP